MRRCAQKGCRNEAQPNMFSCAECVPFNPLTLEEKEGRFWIEFAPPFTDKLSKLKEFVDEHDLLGGLDKKFLRQVFGELEVASLRVTKFKMGIKKESGMTFWTTAFTINNKKEFAGMARSPTDAFLAMAESFEDFINNAMMS